MRFDNLQKSKMKKQDHHVLAGSIVHSFIYFFALSHGHILVILFVERLFQFNYVIFHSHCHFSHNSHGLYRTPRTKYVGYRRLQLRKENTIFQIFLLPFVNNTRASHYSRGKRIFD